MKYEIITTLIAIIIVMFISACITKINTESKVFKSCTIEKSFTFLDGNKISCEIITNKEQQ